MTRRKLVLLTPAVLAGCGWSSGLPTYGTVPEFSLESENGKACGAADLEGQVWVANFFFTTCNGPCPRMSAQLHKLQGMLRGMERVQLISITIDPKRDNVEALAAYAKRWKADPKRWRFLTGALAQVGEVCGRFGVDFWPDQGLITHSPCGRRSSTARAVWPPACPGATIPRSSLVILLRPC